MSCSGSYSLEPLERSWHVDSCYGHNVSRTAFPGVDTLGNNLECSWNMPNGDLVARLLKFDFLETHELARLDLHHKLTFGLVGDTSFALTFY